MVSDTTKFFPILLGDPAAQRQLEGFVVGGMPEGFLEAEIVNRAGPEVANKIRCVILPHLGGPYPITPVGVVHV